MTKDEVYEYGGLVQRKSLELGNMNNYIEDIYSMFKQEKTPIEVYMWLKTVETNIEDAQRIAKLSNTELQEVCKKYRKKIDYIRTLVKNDDYWSKMYIDYADNELNDLEDIVYNRLVGLRVFNMLNELNKAILGYK